MSQDRFFNSLSAGFGDSGAGFAEEELLAYVEGELPADRADALMLRLLADPALFRQLEQMRINRSVLMSMPLEKAPAELLSRVQIAFEQQALVGSPLDEDLGPDLKLVSDGPTLGGMRRMDIHEYRTPWYQSRLAMAAGVLLLLSGGIYWGMSAFSKSPPLPGPIAKLPPDSEPMPLLAADTVPAAETTNSGPAGVDATALAANDNPVLDLVDSAKPTQADLASAISLPDHIITADQAAVLAKDGRLAIRVATLRSEQAAAQVDKLTSIKPEASRSWRVGRDISPEVIATVASATPEPSSQPLRKTRTDDENVVASGSLHDAARFAQTFARIQMPLSPPPMNMPPAYAPRKPVGFVVEVDAASNSLAAIKGLLAEKTDSVATFIELPASVDSGAVTDPAAIMWFTQSPENWVPRVRVPIVVGR